MALAVKEIPNLAPDKYFLVSPQKYILWYLLEAPLQGLSNEYTQCMKNTNIFLTEKRKAAYLSYEVLEDMLRRIWWYFCKDFIQVSIKKRIIGTLYLLEVKGF